MASQLVNLLAAILLLLAFAMLAQRRVLSLIHLFAWQGAALAASTAIVAWSTGQHHLYYSAALTLVLKVIAMPWFFYRLVRKLDVDRDVEPMINIPTTMLIGIVLVIFAFNLAAPISQLAEGITRGLIGIALASVLLSMLMMLTRRKAVSQVVAFLSLENGLFFAATSATQGMPLVVELGIALDVLVATFIFGIFFFQIRETFEKLGVLPEQVCDFLALTGDSSDNVPGVPSVGPKTAATLLAEHPSLDDVYAHVDALTKKALKQKLIDHKADAYLSRELVCLRRDAPVELDVGKRELNLKISEQEMQKRKAGWKPPARKYERSYGAIFAQHVRQADEGCDFDFLEGTAATPEPEIH